MTSTLVQKLRPAASRAADAGGHGGRRPARKWPVDLNLLETLQWGQTPEEAQDLRDAAIRAADR